MLAYNSSISGPTLKALQDYEMLVDIANRGDSQ
jgi:hypothetical protein